MVPPNDPGTNIAKKRSMPTMCSPADRQSSFLRCLLSIHHRQGAARPSSPTLVSSDDSDSDGATNACNTEKGHGCAPLHEKNLRVTDTIDQDNLLATLPKLPFSIEGRRATVGCSPDVHKLKRRPRRRVTFAPALASSFNSAHHGAKVSPLEDRPSELRENYFLGDAVRSPAHMMTQPSNEELGALMVGTLNRHEYAFLRRSDGSYSYAILAYRSTMPVKKRPRASSEQNYADPPTEECMTFVVDDRGSTKTIRERHWGEQVRLVSLQGCEQ